MLRPALVASALTHPEVEQVVAAAISAPSVVNLQPWRFVVTDDAIELHRDEARTLPLTDPLHRAITISCGAALFNLRLAVAVRGWRPDVQVLPDPDRPTLLAVVRLGRPAYVGRTELRLFGAIPDRRTSRVPYLDQPIPPESVVAMETAATTERSTFRVLTPVDTATMLRLVDQAERQQRGNPDVRRELAGWTGRPVGATDGLADNALGPSPRRRSAVRDFGLGLGVPHRSRASFEPEPTLALLITDTDDPASWMRAGQALERVWLEATAAGLAVSLLTQPLELPNQRWRMRPLFAHRSRARAVADADHRAGWPQAVLRIGVPSAHTPRTPRRAVADALTYAPSA